MLIQFGLKGRATRPVEAQGNGIAKGARCRCGHGHEGLGHRFIVSLECERVIAAWWLEVQVKRATPTDGV